MENVLYYGDNLDILKRYVKDESVDLIYLDPPFNSNAAYNVLFKEKDGTEAASQIRAFDDTWTWGADDEAVFREIQLEGGKVADCLAAFKLFLGPCDMLSYLIMMAPRLIELRRIMKPTASIYLHCDPSASHYLKMLMDAIFGAEKFKTEIVWKRSSAHSDAKQGRAQHGRIHDVILFYTKGDDWTWNNVYTPYDQEYIESFYKHKDSISGRLYQMGDLTAAKPGGDTKYEWRIKRHIKSEEWESDLLNEWKKPQKDYEYKGVFPYKGRSWAYSKDNMTKFANEGRICYSGTGLPRYKRYLDEMPGVPLQDIWSDIKPIGALAAERLGYPTQKPASLLERIIQASSNEGDVVLDPFCGCGTTIAAAQALKRNWIGIDITYLALSLMKNRLYDSFGDAAKYKVIGEPVSVPDAARLAETEPYQFQYWALGLVNARPHEEKKGADKGIDGKIVFMGDKPNSFESVVISVKAGKTGAAHVRDLIGVVEREKAAIGVLISMQEPTGPMKTEAATAGFYRNEMWEKKQYQKIQLLTIEDLFAGKTIDMPPIRSVNSTFKKAPKVEEKEKEQKKLFVG